jgi:hypothetical protein
MFDLTVGSQPEAVGYVSVGGLDHTSVFFFGERCKSSDDPHLGECRHDGASQHGVERRVNPIGFVLGDSQKQGVKIEKLVVRRATRELFQVLMKRAFPPLDVCCSDLGKRLGNGPGLLREPFEKGP